MRRSLVLVAAIAAASCGKKSSPPAAGSGSAVVTATADAAVTPPPVDAKAKAAAISKETRAEYKKRLAAGRKAAKAAQWPAAIAELQAALVAIPGDDRALAELSFAAMSAGDHDLARKSGRQAVLAATDPKIKAAALYNLGRVEETGAPAKAAALYLESLALRPNQTVEKRLAELRSGQIFPDEPLPCSKPMTEAQICPCLNDTVEVEGDARDCSVDPSGLPDFQIARYAISELNEHQVMLLGKSDAGWAVVTMLDTIYNPGAFGISEEWSMKEAKDQRLGTRSLAKFVAVKSRMDSDMGINEVESEDVETTTVCVRDIAGGLPTCPLEVATAYSYVRDRILDDDAEMGVEPGDHTADFPYKREFKLSVELGADGVAKVRAVSGRPDASSLGDKKLWP